MADNTEKKEVAPKADSLSMQRRKEQVKITNSRVLTESKKKWLKDAKLAK